MKVTVDKLPHGASLHDVIKAFNVMADKLNEGLNNIDEENISDSLLKEIRKEGKGEQH